MTPRLVPFTSVYLLNGVWYYVWAAGVGTVRVVLWDTLLAETTENVFRYSASSRYASITAAPPIEVVSPTTELRLDGVTLLWSDGEELTFGNSTLAVSEANEPRLVLQWYRVPCHHYRIEVQDGSGTWRFFSTLSDDATVFIQTFTTPLLADGVTTYWRVTAIDSNKRESDPVNFRSFIVRPPDPPAVPKLACAAGLLRVG